MHPAIQFQSDDPSEVDARSKASAAVVPSGSRVDMARQEFRADQDINAMLKKFGVMVPQLPLQFGDVDFSIDLQTALGAIHQAKQAWNKLPADIKADYPSWQSLLNAMERGEVNLRTGEPEAPETVPEMPAPIAG